jgi:hypothetical protein
LITLCCAVMLLNGCTTVKQTRLSVDKPAERHYCNMYLVVDLGDNSDIVPVTRRFNKVFEQHNVKILLPEETPGTSSKNCADFAVLKIKEVKRQTVTVVRYRQYARTSLTMNHGREVFEKPVITLRATLVDQVAGLIVFQADYVTEGQWYQNSATVISSLAGVLVEQLLHQGFINTACSFCSSPVPAVKNIG